MAGERLTALLNEREQQREAQRKAQMATQLQAEEQRQLQTARLRQAEQQQQRSASYNRCSRRLPPNSRAMSGRWSKSGATRNF